MKATDYKRNNDDSDLHKDEVGENTGEDTLLAKQDKLKPCDRDNTEQESSNKGKGPAGEDL
ncbi:hypothetical protein SAMN05216464_101812 [Mucilaginibacter pineti]|uniref:Uncharacterized protein n=1 Tax=Mucilaginibacter pineti TaxID=1391627 RepID=A0A1G6V1V4_9SPHI|nr:hypothetical protein [Mucilaginibacter pineti]SDD46845.1 hypothetical protein SAMN05216464_101812 [Mucilaginibacter pineti]